jgi:hypothetical protein
MQVRLTDAGTVRSASETAVSAFSGHVARVPQSAIRWGFGLAGKVCLSVGGTDAVSSPVFRAVETTCRDAIPVSVTRLEFSGRPEAGEHRNVVAR